MNIRDLIVTDPHFIEPHVAKKYSKKIIPITFALLALTFLFRRFDWYVIEVGEYLLNLEIVIPTLQAFTMYLIWRGSRLTTRSYFKHNNFTRYEDVKFNNYRTRTFNLFLGGLFMGISLGLFHECIQSTQQTIQNNPDLLIQATSIFQ